ncbi:hypothetical protein [Nigerium massiliense]|uniref:hypothetical protein n=1 Tax=Nigerium massiliense TaxID=1522317 RepID=UPI001F286818|nr:hypothetical protein [Nigerium massiliense]
MAADDVLPDGLYESVVTDALMQRLSTQSHVPEFADIDPADLPDVLGQHLRDAVVSRLTSKRTPAEQLELAARLMEFVESPEHAPSEGRLLTALRAAGGPGRVSWPPHGRRPTIPLADAALLTNAHGEPSIGSELRAELDTSDRVDLLIAFVM